MPRLRIAILNSYNLPGRRGSESLRVRGFLRALAAHGWIEGRDFEAVLLDFNARPAMEEAIRQLAAEPVDLIQAFGTPNAVNALEVFPGVPMIYGGAHPERIGEATLGADNVTGLMFHLPFTASYKSFRFLLRLVPRVRSVWTVFFEGTLFVPPAMRELHHAARDGSGRPVWLSSGDGPVGYPSLAGLAEILGLEYRELIYADAAELARAIDEIDPETGVFINHTELLHCPGAFEAVLARTAERNVPAIFNNGAQATTYGLFAGIAVDWPQVGWWSGETAARILAGAPPREIPREVHAGRIAWINLDTARRLGLDPDPEVLSQFGRVITGQVDDVCM